MDIFIRARPAVPESTVILPPALWETAKDVPSWVPLAMNPASSLGDERYLPHQIAVRESIHTSHPQKSVSIPKKMKASTGTPVNERE